MTTPQVTTRMNHKRKAFTLVELMIVILIIGLLVAISSPFIFAALTRARAFAIQNEMMQIDATVKRFETEHNFYPPTFNVPGGINSAADMRRYLNRIAPNNAEFSSGGLAKWWTQVGTKLDIETSLVFWLSGLCTNKQYPLSGNATIANDPSVMALAPYNINKDFNDIDIAATIDRQIFFEFELGRLVSNHPDAGIKSYNQPYGKGDALAYRYLSSKSYVGGSAYHAGVDANGNPNFFNPDSFQIIGPGMDGVVTIVQPPNLPVTNTAVLSVTSSTGVDFNGDGEPDGDLQEDNMTNFSNGRLDLVFE